MLRDFDVPDVNTPAGQIQIIQNYWRAAASGDAIEPGVIKFTQTAMQDLVQAGAKNPETRAQFAAASVFESATMGNDVLADAQLEGYRDFLRRTGASTAFETRSLRQIMLDELDKAVGKAGLTGKPSEGLAPWLHSAEVSAGSIGYTMTKDPDPVVRAAALKLVSDAAIPRFWADFFAKQQTFNAIAEALASSTLDAGTRQTLMKLSRGAQGAVLASQAKPDVAEATTGDGQRVSVMKAPPAPWFENTQVMAGALIALVIGAAYAKHSKSQS